MCIRDRLHGCCKYDREASVKTQSCCGDEANCKHKENHDGMAKEDCCKDGKCTKAGHDGKDCCKKDGEKMDCCKDGKCTKEGHDGKDCCKKSDK